MHRPRLIAAWALVLASAACKADAPKTTTQTQAVSAPPGAEVWAASGVVRVVDPAQQKVRAKLAVGHPITTILFDAAAKTAWIGTSEGLYAVDVASMALEGPLTPAPIRHLEWQGPLLAILQHQVVLGPDETREVLPFRQVLFDPATKKVVGDEEIGQRIHYAGEAEGHHLVITESGEVRLGARPESLAAGTPLNLPALVPGRGPYRVRGDVTVRQGSRALVAIEGRPAHLLVIDLQAGSAQAIDLGRETGIRGLAFSADGKVALVNAMTRLYVVDLARREVTAELELPGPHVGAALGSDGRALFLAQTVEGTGGAITAVSLSPLAVQAHVHLDDISPWAIAVR